MRSSSRQRHLHRSTLALSVLACTVACTIESADLSVAAPVEIIDTLPVHLESDVYRDAPVSFWFSEPLDPGSIDSTPISVTSQQVRQGGSFRYDPLERRLTYTPRGLYRSELAYDATLDETIRSLRTGALVEPTTITFITSSLEQDIGDPLEPVDFESEVLPLFQRSCAFSGCHAPPEAASSIDLSSTAGVSSSTIAASCRGWPGWLVVDPWSAAWSYLVYKLIDEETIRGNTMPPGVALPPSEIETISRWIDLGAKVDRDSLEP